MNLHAPIQADTEAGGGFDRTCPIVPVSRVWNAAYSLDKAAMALSYATTPISKRIAQEAYDAACDDMLALLQKRKGNG